MHRCNNCKTEFPELEACETATECPLCQGNWETEELPCNSRYTTALKEGRCYICGTHGGETIKVLDQLYHIELRTLNMMPLCNICISHIPENSKDIPIDILVWDVLKKRLNQYTIYSKQCKHCGCPIKSARKIREFCSNNCRAKYWNRNHKLNKLTDEGEYNGDITGNVVL